MGTPLERIAAALERLVDLSSVPCDSCGGAGKFSEAFTGRLVTCQLCGGSGRIQKTGGDR